MKPALLFFVGFGLCVAVMVWDFLAKKLTTALFVSRLLAPLIAAFLWGVAVYWVICGQH